MDKICLAISIVGILAYILLRHQPVLALAIVSVAEVISFIPTVRKTRNDPYSESLTNYYWLLAKLGLILIALKRYNLLTVSYSAMWTVIFIAFMAATYRWRTIKKQSHRAEGDTSDFIAV